MPCVLSTIAVIVPVDGSSEMSDNLPDMSGFDTPTILHGWAFALRDLCDQGAVAARVTLPGDTGPVHVYYAPGKGCKVTTEAGTLDIPDEALDQVGLVVA
jgi:hypothetical protein